MPLSNHTTAEGLHQRVEFFRIDANRKINQATRGQLGQFMTPASVAGFMASLFGAAQDEIQLLDPGAGVGSLTAAFVEEIATREEKPSSIEAVAYEIEPVLLEYLNATIEDCRHSAQSSQIKFSGSVRNEDFIQGGVAAVLGEDDLFGNSFRRFTHCIMNPPYKKISSNSQHRALLRSIGMETSNLYTAFLTIAIQMLGPGGELVAIIPRSFCNGVYFKPFRQFFFEHMSLRHIHVFDSRSKTFKEDEVLQENVIIHAIKNPAPHSVVITSSSDASFTGMTQRKVPLEKVVNRGDPHQFIHIAVNELDQAVVDRMMRLECTLEDIGLKVATGPVVDFRLRNDIWQEPKPGSYPLIYATHFDGGRICWPKLGGKKPNAITESEKSSRWLMPNGWYVLTKRFSAKEERRRIVAAVHSPNDVRGDLVGFENHLNVYHHDKQGIDPAIAKGLCGYLNSSLVDLYFRQFSGHTQVNATDLRILRYPCIDTLQRIGAKLDDTQPNQSELDAALDEILAMSDEGQSDPVAANHHVREALDILQALGLPRGQRNERSALTLLALLDLKPDNPWENAQQPLMGITPIMDFCREHYGRAYAPNTRESIRRQTMHQFMEAGLAVANPDQPDRAVNSPKWVYQVEPNALELLKAFGKPEWKEMLQEYLGKQQSLAEKYAGEREMQMIPLLINEGKELSLTPGEHSLLIKQIVEEFGPRYAPGAEVLYVGDTGAKMGHFDEARFKELGLTFDSHGKFPDVVLYFADKNWLLLIESVTSHGPVDAKRHAELSALFEDSTAGLVFVTAFSDRATMGKYIAAISWETEVWVAEAPTHLIHFDGEKFLGPYEQS